VTVDGKPAREVVIGKLNSEKDAKLGASALECLPVAVVLALNPLQMLRRVTCGVQHVGNDLPKSDRCSGKPNAK
jgi:hypothetical protein